MKTYKSWFQYKLSFPNIVEDSDDMVLFESFIAENLKTSLEFPPNDELYYKALEAQLVHLLYKFEKGWISSPRQVMYNSDECISNVHFVMNSKKEVTQINVFQRSSNLYNLEEDVQFFNYFKNKHGLNHAKVSILVSMPHAFKDKMKKIED